MTETGGVTHIDVDAKEINGRMFIDRNDLLGTIRTVALKGGTIEDVEAIVAGFNFEGKVVDLHVGGESPNTVGPIKPAPRHIGSSMWDR